MFRKLGFDYVLFLTENSKLATGETPNITYGVRALNKKNEIKTQKCP